MSFASALNLQKNQKNGYINIADCLDWLLTCFSFQPTQTELVLLIFLRLAEDILIFQSAPAQRRRDIVQGLTNVMPQLFPWFINTLESNVMVYKQTVVSN